MPPAPRRPLLLRGAEPLPPGSSAAYEPVDLLALVDRLVPSAVPAASAPVREPAVLLLCWPGNRDAPLLERELLGRGVASLRLSPDTVAGAGGFSWRRYGGHERARLRLAGRPVAGEGVEAVWYSLAGFGPSLGATGQFPAREWTAALAGAWRGLGRRWVNRPDAVAAASDKLGHLRAATAAGFAVPDTLVTDDTEAARAFVAEYAGRVVAKTLSGGRIEDDDGARAMIFTRRLGDADLAGPHPMGGAPCLLQEEVPKRADVRVAVVGDQLFAARIDAAAGGDVDVRRTLPDAPMVAYEVPAEVAERSLALVRHMGLRYAGLDLVLTPDGRHVFLEANARGAFWFLQQRTGQPIAAAVADLLTGG